MRKIQTQGFTKIVELFVYVKEYMIDELFGRNKIS